MEGPCRGEQVVLCPWSYVLTPVSRLFTPSGQFRVTLLIFTKD